MEKVKCNHCAMDCASIRTARAHHPKCPNVKSSDLECRELTGCACDPCFTAPSQAIEFLEMAHVQAPAVPDSDASQSAMERATGYSKKAEKLFGSKKSFNVEEQSEEEADSAWAL